MAIKDVYVLGIAIDGEKAAGGIQSVTNNLNLMGAAGTSNASKIENTLVRLGGRFGGVGREVVTLASEFGALGIGAGGALAIIYQGWKEQQAELKKTQDAIKATEKAYEDLLQTEGRRGQIEAKKEQIAALTAELTNLINVQARMNAEEAAGNRFMSVDQVTQQDEAIKKLIFTIQGLQNELKRLTQEGIEETTAALYRMQNEMESIARRNADAMTRVMDIWLQRQKEAADRQKAIDDQLNPFSPDKVAAYATNVQNNVTVWIQAEERKAEASLAAAKKAEQAWMDSIDRISAALGRLGGPLGHAFDIGGALFHSVTQLKRGE